MDILFIRDKVRHTDRADGKKPVRELQKKVGRDGGRPRERKTKRSEIES